MTGKAHKSFSCTAAVLAALLLASCAPAQDAQETTAPAPAVRTVTGTASMTWHGTTKFVAVVEVTVEGNVLQQVSIRDGSTVTTDAFTGWIKGQEEYLGQYTGKTVEQIKALELSGPENPGDHHDGGSMSGDIDAITGATASSVSVAMAVQNAVEKLEG